MNWKKIYCTFLLILIVTLVNCADNKEANADKDNQVATSPNLSPDSTVLKVYLNENNNVIVNGVQVDLDSLDSYISSRRNKVSNIYYSRYNAQDPEGPKETIKVMEIIAKQNLPISFFPDSTFSTVIEN